MKHPNNFCISYLQGEGKKLLSGLRMMEKRLLTIFVVRYIFQNFMEKEVLLEENLFVIYLKLNMLINKKYFHHLYYVYDDMFSRLRP